MTSMGMVSTTTEQVGWFPDPHVAGILRYHDGARWTEHTLAAPASPAPARVPSPSTHSAEFFWEATGTGGF